MVPAALLPNLRRARDLATGTTPSLSTWPPWPPRPTCRSTSSPAEEDAAAFRRMLDKGSLGGVGLATDDCRKTFEELTAQGATIIQEPAERPYGVEAILRDSSGNWLVLVEPRPYTPEDLGPT